MQPIVKMVWTDKYRHGVESTPEESMSRVVTAVFASDPRKDEFISEALEALVKREFSPGGRIHASAGTGTGSTWINCYVSRAVDDSMFGIMDGVKESAETLRSGGGIGMDFSTLRPNGAVVRGVGSVASGPIGFMDVWDAMCATVISGNSRRGAMMATLSDDHPDILDFIAVKREPGRLTNFNLSVLVSDKFMTAVENDSTWKLGFTVPPVDGEESVEERNGVLWYVYKTLPARELWDLLTKNSYDFAEPGVIFIDRINYWNNLAYVENIRCINPCGEQPLPPFGACDLGCLNLAAFILDPFSDRARVDYGRLARVSALAVRFLDNVLDQTPYPLPEQRKEALAKRRIGLGVMGLGNALQMLCSRYGDKQSITHINNIMAVIRDAAYMASIELAKERAPFPLFDSGRFLSRPFIQALPDEIQDDIHKYGIRNGVLLTIAPTGTTSIYYGNVSGGVEPSFAWRYFRKVLQTDGSKKEFAVLDAGFLEYCKHQGLDPVTCSVSSLPGYMVTATELSVQDHINVQSVCQKYIDSSISKTVNCPPNITLEAYQNVFKMAYDLGCKGCTTYRPNSTRGSVLSTESQTMNEASAVVSNVKRPSVLHGHTYKCKWPLSEENMYITINEMNGKPFEIFVSSHSAEYAELLSAITILMSAVMREGKSINFMIEDLGRVKSSQGAFVNGKYTHGVVSMIAGILKRHVTGADSAVKDVFNVRAICPKCGVPALIKSSGCDSCTDCGYSKCG